MSTITLRHINAAGEVLNESVSEGLCMLDKRYCEYQPGDRIVLECSETPCELEVSLDESLAPSVVYLPEGHMEFPIPTEAARDGYPQQAFGGDCHFGWARELTDRDRANWRNLALNSHDLEGASGVFPHATTNSGATNPRFWARNAINGTFQSCHHGRWPYESWGINGRADAWLQVDFGRTVHAEEAVLFLRADFPHDTWWEYVTLTCSDGFETTAHLTKTGMPQRIDLGERDIEWIRLHTLVRADDPSEWPALSQMMVMGTLA